MPRQPDGLASQALEPTYFDHPLLSHVLRLRERQCRDQSGSFLVEGIRFLKQAHDYRVRIHFVIVAPEMLTSPFGRQLVSELWQSGVPCLQVSNETFEALSLLHHRQGVAAVVEQRWTALRKAHPNQVLCWLALSRIQSPGNLGTILRTASAVGAAGVILIGEQVDPFHPTTLRATMGAVFSLRYVRTTPERFRDWVTQHRCTVIGAAPGARRCYDQVRYPRNTVLWMGNERKGLSPAEQQLCHRLVKIPMVGDVDSLNVSVAAGILLYEVFRQRQ